MQTRLVDVIFKALAPIMGDKVVAGTKAMRCQAGFGGIDPRTGEYYCFYEALAGGIVSFRTCGGEGFGPPDEREPELVLADVRQGKVSIERAREIYKVVIDPRTWTVGKGGVSGGGAGEHRHEDDGPKGVQRERQRRFDQ